MRNHLKNVYATIAAASVSAAAGSFIHVKGQWKNL